MQLDSQINTPYYYLIQGNLHKYNTLYFYNSFLQLQLFIDSYRPELKPEFYFKPQIPLHHQFSSENRKSLALVVIVCTMLQYALSAVSFTRHYFKTLLEGLLCIIEAWLILSYLR